MAYDNKPLSQGVITIESYAIKVYPDGGQQYDIKSDKGKYKFSAKTKEGKETKAMQTFRELGIGNGMTVTIGYSETDKIFTQGGQEIPYVERRIMYFSSEAPKEAKRPTPAPVQAGMNPMGDMLKERVEQLEMMVSHQQQAIEAANRELMSLKSKVGIPII